MPSPSAASHSVETRASWVVAVVALVILAVAYGGPLLTAVALKPIADDLAAPRSAPALATSLAYIGAGVGGILAGYLSERVGIRIIVMFGAAMIAAGLALGAAGGLLQLYVGQGVLMGLFGTSCMFAPVMTYVSRWFDRRRGTAVALISSGQYLAGVIWPALFQLGVEHIGWRRTMTLYGVTVAVLVIPLAALFLRPPPKAPAFSLAHRGPPRGSPVIGLPPNLALALLSLASFCCCVTMAMPMQHLVAFCTDVGIAPTQGALMLSVLLGSAFLSRQFWGWLSDRIGGLPTVLCASAAQAVAMTGFLLTQGEAGLFVVSTAFGLGYSGLIPAYIVAVRALYPADEAGWRVPVVLFTGMLGMAAGGWGAGVLYDHFGFYAPAFGTGILFNLLNLAVILPLVLRQRALRGQPVLA